VRPPPARSRSSPSSPARVPRNAPPAWRFRATECRRVEPERSTTARTGPPSDVASAVRTVGAKACLAAATSGRQGPDARAWRPCSTARSSATAPRSSSPAAATERASHPGWQGHRHAGFQGAGLLRHAEAQHLRRGQACRPAPDQRATRQPRQGGRDRRRGEGRRQAGRQGGTDRRRRRGAGPQGADNFKLLEDLAAALGSTAVGAPAVPW